MLVAKKRALALLSLFSGILICAGQGLKIGANAEKDAVLATNHEVLDEAQRIVGSLKSGSSVTFKDAASIEQELAAKESGRNEEEIALRQELLLLRQQLFLDETKREVPAALEGYKRLATRLEARLDALEAAKGVEEAAFDEGLRGYESQLGPEAGVLGEAAFELAVMTLTGLAGPLLPRNQTRGIQLLQQSADAGSVEALLALSNRLLTGSGLPKDCDAAVRNGEEAARFYVEETAAARVFLPPVAPLLLRERWRNADFVPPPPPPELAATGDGDAFGGLAGADTWGLMQTMDPDFGWNLPGVHNAAGRDNPVPVLQRLAAEQDAEALFNLGYLYIQGIDVPRNTTAAFYLFKAAMLQGSPAAHNALGVLFHEGLEVPRDAAAARQYFEAGAALGDVDAMFNLGMTLLAEHENRSADNSSQADLELALEHLLDANDNQHWQAPYQLAKVYYLGLGTPKDCLKAARHLDTFLVERAPWHDDIHLAVNVMDAGDEWRSLVSLALVAEQGSTAAQHNLAYALQTSKTFMLPERYSLAYDMYLRSGSAGYFAPGLTDAARMLWNGHKYQLPSGTNRTKALELYEEASSQKDTEATFYLAAAHQAGTALRRNTTRAAELYAAAIRMAPSERFAAPPFVALQLLRLDGLRRRATRRLAGVAAFVAHRDLALLSGLASGLAGVLFLLRQRRRARQAPQRHSRQE